MKKIVILTLVLMTIAVSLGGCDKETAGAVGGAAVGGIVGGAAGGTTGAVIGGAAGAGLGYAIAKHSN